MRTPLVVTSLFLLLGLIACTPGSEPPADRGSEGEGEGEGVVGEGEGEGLVGEGEGEGEETGCARGSGAW